MTIDSSPLFYIDLLNPIQLFFGKMSKKKLIIFDGVCKLCNYSVQFIIKRDSKQVYQFVSSQNPNGESLLKELNFNPKDLSSWVLLDNSKIYQKSDGILQVIKDLDGFWYIFGISKILPKFIRDSVYDLIAKNRRKFGTVDSCMLMKKDEFKNRFPYG